MHPLLFQLGPLTIYSYGALIALGTILGVLIGRHEFARLGLPREGPADLVLIGIPAGLVGGKLVYLATIGLAELKRDVWGHLSPRFGLVWYGVLGAVLLSTATYARLKRIPALGLIDAGIPAVTLGHAVGRLGCFMAGCCYGRETTLPWGVLFTDLGSSAPLGVRLHPTQLYMAGHAFAVFLFLWWLRRRKRFAGELLLAFVIAYAPGRFLIELWRGDLERGTIAGVSTSQFLSLVAAALALAAWPLLRRRTARA